MTILQHTIILEFDHALRFTMFLMKILKSKLATLLASKIFTRLFIRATTSDLSKPRCELEKPFGDNKFGDELAVKIIVGLKNDFALGTPNCYVKLAKKRF
ncbi:hypothetical protein F8M41_001834 [Gigaspora margarita]|uniref:Uncharacterized protein n=1 Tax=Gigaspora margarita TaxID=4874 RepID=A0A8H4AYX6_GIGMA|nr:hypothetical protein F8M41_001834 [Gigaspora margarita]